MNAILSDGLEKRFGKAAHGVRWALGQIPGGREESGRLWAGDRRIELTNPGAAAGDSFALKWSAGEVVVRAGTAVALIKAFLEIARQLKKDGCRDAAWNPQFKTRNYKHEACLESAAARGKARPASVASREAWVWKYSEAFLEKLFQEIVSRGFNGFVLYSGYHPFEFFLDYKGFPHATYQPAELRRRNFEGLWRLFDCAGKYGLRTFLHHYVTHFTQALSDHLELGLSEENGTRLACFEHPVVEEYNRYIYQRTFETLTPLDGLYINFESSGNTVPYMKKTLVRVANAMPRKPVLFFRLWGVSDVEGMAALLRSYRGPKAFIHKGHDTSDTYFYPVADDRVKVWKKAMPEVEFVFSLGPCHNCGTNISRRLWTDPDYIHALMKNMQAKGADSISFQSSKELLLNELPDNDIFSQADIDHARMNLGHLEAVVDYVSGRCPGRPAWAARYAEWYRTSPAGGEAIRTAIVESSQIMLKQYRQFCYGSSAEGYMYPHRHSHYQEPFYYCPMSFMNRIGEIPHNIIWRTWAVRDKPIRVVPDDTQAIIDSVNPAVRERPANNPLALVRQIKGHIRRARAAAARYGRIAGKRANPALIAQVRRNCLNGERVWREIMIARHLYSCYFAPDSRSFFDHLRLARDLMRESVAVLGGDIAGTDNFYGPYVPGKDAAALDAILCFQHARFPQPALRAYLRSHERYNEIRRLCRPYASVRGQMVRRNLGLLKASLAEAEAAVALLSGNAANALYRDNVQAWRDYVRAEIDYLTLPAMPCPADEAVAPAAGFRMMTPEHDYRWGEDCWEDFASFFRRHEFFGCEEYRCRATHTEAGLKVTLSEGNIKWAEREALWKVERNTFSRMQFMQVLVDPGNTARRVLHYQIFYMGEGGQVRTLEENAHGRLADTKPAPMVGCRTYFQHTDSTWRCDVVIPWAQLGGRPKKNAIWRLNVLSNSSGSGNSGFSTWTKGYGKWVDIARLGYLVFA